MEEKINDVLTILDDKSYLRSQLFKLFAINSIDGMKFYYFMGEKSQLPVIGLFFKKLMESYYKHVHTGAVKLPLDDIEEVIRKADHVSVGPCPCRLIFDKNECEAPVFTCIKINYFSRFTTVLEKISRKLSEERGLQVGNRKSKVLTKDEALEILRNDRKHNLIFSLESCITPYQNNICACCTDCCIELNLRYKFGLKVSPRGPYMPVFNHEKCTECGDCAGRCPVRAITAADGKPSANMDICLGCGICAENCQKGAVSMAVDKKMIPSIKKPGKIKLVYIFFLSFVMFCIFSLYKLTIKGENVKYFLGRPRESDIIQ